MFPNHVISCVESTPKSQPEKDAIPQRDDLVPNPGAELTGHTSEGRKLIDLRSSQWLMVYSRNSDV